MNISHTEICCFRVFRKDSLNMELYRAQALHVPCIYETCRVDDIYQAVLRMSKKHMMAKQNTVEPLNYGHRGTTLNCPQKGGVLYTKSAPVNVTTISSYCIRQVRKLSVYKHSLSAERP